MTRKRKEQKIRTYKSFPCDQAVLDNAVIIIAKKEMSNSYILMELSPRTQIEKETLV
jgi:hypothetical protein